MFPLYGVALTESMFHTLNAVIVPATSHVYGRLRTLVQWNAVTSARHSSQNNGRAYAFGKRGTADEPVEDEGDGERRGQGRDGAPPRPSGCRMLLFDGGTCGRLRRRCLLGVHGIPFD